MELQQVMDREVNDASVSLVAGDRDSGELCDLQLGAEGTACAPRSGGLTADLPRDVGRETGIGQVLDHG